MDSYRFCVKVRGFEPMSGRKGKGMRLQKKMELVRAIRDEAEEDIQRASDALQGKHVHLKVCFYLWKGDEAHTNTTSKKDLDNLLKLVFDALQFRLDTEHATDGLQIINSDEDVFYAEATKEIVNDRNEAGLDLEVSEYRDTR